MEIDGNTCARALLFLGCDSALRARSPDEPSPRHIEWVIDQREWRLDAQAASFLTGRTHDVAERLFNGALVPRARMKTSEDEQLQSSSSVVGSTPARGSPVTAVASDLSRKKFRSARKLRWRDQGM